MIDLKIIGIALSLSLLAGCSSLDTGKDRAWQLNDEPLALEIPPDLTTPKDSGLLAMPEPDISSSSRGVEKRLLQKLEHVELLRDGSNYWIQVAGDRKNIWANLLQFWEETQIDLRVDNRAHGIIETSWFSGNDQRFATDTKNKFRLRVELVADGDHSPAKPLEIYITHYGAIATGADSEQPQWRIRERDRDLELEFLHQLADYLNREQAKVAVTKKRSSQYDISNEKLLISAEFRNTWRQVGIALERANILVNDRDRNRGVYFVTEVAFLEELNSQRGMLSRWFADDEVTQERPFEVHIKSRGARSEISIEGETITPAKRVYLLKAIRDHL